ncbi:hypothetical protein [Sphingobium algorifonticola]|uniref:hypothetical protein n=1 Tax=Sphingobium algorifonticola TaxID=2008318 RepID=UPI0013E2E2C9|nr:hypothetical protein [Sphingobium algorifonticola]
MMGEPDYRAAIRRAEEQRARLIADARAFGARIAPERLKADVREQIRTAVSDAGTRAKATVRSHPVAAGAIGAGLLAWLFRRPIGRLIGRLRRPQAEPLPPPPVQPQPIVRDDDVGALPPDLPPAPPPAAVVTTPAPPPLPETDDEE